MVHTLSCSAARQRCHSRCAKVTGCEKGRSTSRSAEVSQLLEVLAAGIVVSDVLSIGWLYSGPTFTATTVWSNPAQVVALRRILGG